jgi:hypothetical protein
MANFSDNLNKTIAQGYNTYGQLRAIGDALGILSGGKPRGRSLTSIVGAEFRQNGVARPTLAFTEVALPPCMTRDSFEFGDKLKPGTAGNFIAMAGSDRVRFLSYRNDSFSTPGMSIATTDIRRYGVGPTEKKPYGVIYQDVTFNYILDTQNSQHKFFYRWMDSIIDHDRKTSDVSRPTYEVGYKKDFQTTINIHAFDDRFDQGQAATDLKMQTVTLEQAYPIFIGDIQYNWGGIDTLIRLPVTFTFSRWETIVGKVEDVRTTANPGLGLFGQLLKAGTALQALSTLRNPRNISDVLNVVNTGSIITK